MKKLGLTFLIFLSFYIAQAQISNFLHQEIKGIKSGLQKEGKRQIGLRGGGGFTGFGAINLTLPTSDNKRITFEIEFNYLNQLGNKYAVKNYNPFSIGSTAGSREWLYVSPTIIKNWVFPFSIAAIKGFSWYVGVGATLALGFNLNYDMNNFYLETDGRQYKGDDFRLGLGVVGDVGVEYNFESLNKQIPLILSLDLRPTIGYKIPFTSGYGFHFTDVFWGNIGLGAKYLF